MWKHHFTNLWELTTIGRLGPKVLARDRLHGVVRVASSAQTTSSGHLVLWTQKRAMVASSCTARKTTRSSTKPTAPRPKTLCACSGKKTSTKRTTWKENAGKCSNSNLVGVHFLFSNTIIKCLVLSF